MTETWYLLESPAAAAAWNMAVDEALLQTAGARRYPLLRVYRWDRPSVSIGYFQKYPAHLAATHAIVRRPTGGGLVYHGEDTTITIVVPPGHALDRMSTAEAYGAVHQAIIAAFSPGCARVSDPARDTDRRSPRSESGRPRGRGVGPGAGSGLPAVGPAKAGDPRTTEKAVTAESEDRRTAGVTLHAAPVTSARGQYECFQKPVAGDVVAGGRKLAGGAQRRTKDGLLHQGSIAVRVTAEQLAAGVTEIFQATLATYHVTRAERHLADQLVREKYDTDEWNKRFA